jgi:hypothetical protein
MEGAVAGEKPYRVVDFVLGSLPQAENKVVY